MCGRYSIVRGDRILTVVPNVTMPANLRLVGRYNAAPSQLLPVITNDSRDVQMLKWGLIPSWAKDAKVGYKMINARVETLAERPAYRKALESRRCLIPADGFYEWRKRPNGTKTPMYIHMKDGELFAFAGLWERWKDEAGQEVKSFTVITTEPNELMKTIHNRMPAIVPKEGYLDWLENGSTEWLKPYPAEEMEAYAVSPRVNSPGRDEAGMIERVEEFVQGEAVPEEEAKGQMELF
jgi:putative SOS response-associated peptidase YedK